MTLFFIFFYPTFICGFTATSVPTFIWHFFITSHAGICSAEGLFTPTFTCNLYSPSASILFHLNVTLPQGFFPYLSEAYPRRASNYRISSISHHFFIRSMSAEGISIKRMVKITQSCSIFNSPRYSPLISKTYYNNPVFFLSEAYPRRA